MDTHIADLHIVPAYDPNTVQRDVWIWDIFYNGFGYHWTKSDRRSGKPCSNYSRIDKWLNPKFNDYITIATSFDIDGIFHIIIIK